MTRDGENFQGRTIRVKVADPRTFTHSAMTSEHRIDNLLQPREETELRFAISTGPGKAPLPTFLAVAATVAPISGSAGLHASL